MSELLVLYPQRLTLGKQGEEEEEEEGPLRGGRGHPSLSLSLSNRRRRLDPFKHEEDAAFPFRSVKNKKKQEKKPNDLET